LLGHLIYEGDSGGRLRMDMVELAERQREQVGVAAGEEHTQENAKPEAVALRNGSGVVERQQHGRQQPWRFRECRRMAARPLVTRRTRYQGHG